MRVPRKVLVLARHHVGALGLRDAQRLLTWGVKSFPALIDICRVRAYRLLVLNHSGLLTPRVDLGGLTLLNQFELLIVVFLQSVGEV